MHAPLQRRRQRQCALALDPGRFRCRGGEVLGGEDDVGHDPIEDDPKVRAIIEQVDKEVERLLEQGRSVRMCWQRRS